MGNNLEIWKNIGLNICEGKNRIMGNFLGIISLGLMVFTTNRSTEF